MQFRSTPRAESPTHQQLYKRNPSNSVARRRNSITPSRNSTGLALAVVPPGNSPRRGSTFGAAGSAGEEMVYVADVNPTYSVTATVRCFVPVNERVMWSAEFNGCLCVRALPKGTSLRTLPGREDTCCISLLHVPKVEQVWAGFQDGYLHVYDARTMELMKETMTHGGGLHCMTQVDDTVFTGGADWKICQWGFEGGAPQLLRTLHGHRGGVRSFGVYDGPTGAVLFSGSDDGTIRAWDPYVPAAGADADAANIHVFSGHDRAVLSLAVISHMNQLWSGGEDMTVRVWDMQTLECLAVLRSGHTAPVANLMVVESRVWSADKHGHILLWDITTRSLLQDLAERVPYWGIGQGMILAMQKVQPTTAYKVWTASSNGVLQCWNAETIPIVFNDVPIAAGVLRHAGSASKAIAGAAGGAPESPRKPGGGRGVSPASSRGADAADTSALTVSTNNNNNAVDVSNSTNGRGVASPAQTAAAARMQGYVENLQQELQNAQRDAKLNYEKYRVEVQLEIETQQLLAQENAQLRDRVKELEEMAGVPHEEIHAARTSPLAAGSAPGHTALSMSSSAADAEALTAEIDDLRQQLDEAHQQLDEAHQRLDEALRNAPGQQSPPVTDTPLGGNLQKKSSGAGVDLDGPPTDPARQFVRQDDLAQLPATSEDVLSDSTGLGRPSATGATRQFSAILSTPLEAQWKTGTITRTSLVRHFDGDNWEYLINEKPYELHSTLTADLCAGLGVAPTQLERVEMHDDGLTVEADVVHPVTVPAAELERRMREYRFPGLMKMHADAFTTTKTSPDTAEATIIDLQEQLTSMEKALEEAQEEQRAQPRVEEPSPEPQQPYSALRAGNDGVGGQENTAAEQQRLRDANAKLQDELEDQLQTIEQLQSAMEEKENELASAQVDLRNKENELKHLTNAQEQHTPNTRRTRDSPDSQGLRLYDSAVPPPPPALDGTARKKPESESGRPTELLAVPLAQEMTAAAASGGVGAQDDDVDSSSNNAQRNAPLLQQALKEANDTIAALEAQKKKADAAAAGLADQNARLTQQAAQLQQEVKAQKQRLAAAAAASPTALAKTPSATATTDTTTPASTSLEKDEVSNKKHGKEEELRQLREDHDALNSYLHDQLKPLISRLKRARGELQLDKDRLLERVAAMEKAASDATAQSENGDGATKARGSAGKGKSAQGSSRDAPASSTDPQDDEASTQQLREDHEALDNYLHEQVKPMISGLKRAKGELQLDLSRAQESLKHACDMYDEAAAALEEARVREEKMGEAMETLKKALEAEQQKNQALTKAPPGAAAGPGQRPGSAEKAEAEASNLRDTVDRLTAQNADLSARLAEAEMVMAHLQDSLGQSAHLLKQSVDQLAEQRSETQRLLNKIEKFQQNCRSHSENVPSVSTSDSLP
ncbi:hypothetical protein ABB37_06442 [Leptomonas pyrrhocoris]|uniref:Flagellar attachment zone protein 1 conserved domain-containing protein n=1 Tax=Leptomonas pyrrhocoris TaxID=157538 RepID=A0A0M9FY16_LEPPY|nr:hypothetical protein ABB37_06442 [Leptomonas pyrrhocoris]XP_015656743.1 hypothetical protein ABB37_06442 [Leptomonas pyrrhocoris]XP_015656744.1 hypothetical protein ABB37_06442 [Leptomonas pyrrhocoris]KPA78303.1 hypothetical protein ABB37_06442 [Leptomonas pyrrhocoris]KPA78304.1 hypothetical protein ABB37_06442 [Leptomonas pyrrhocoris]KPA78305.1 hypothetical protein ABB37_06442 [Leptomonas pyrrhocoris]|eukprot:XP_015656742.1 hypothetical protein ABB37_06442 [Leptomonas pyrrhocoris]